MRGVERQTTDMEMIESRLRRIGQELTAVGIEVPTYHESRAGESVELAPIGPEDHHKISRDSAMRVAVDVRVLHQAHLGDPAMQVGTAP